MNNTRKLPVSMTGSELWLGLCFLPVQLFVLPELLGIANDLLPVPMSASWINFVFFSMNFICVLCIFYRYLWKSLDYSLQRVSLCLFSALRGYIGYYALTFLVDSILTAIDPSFFNVNDKSIMVMTQENFRVTAVGTVLLVPLAEEVLYRGVIFGGLQRKNRLLAYCVSATVFSLVHIAGYIGAYDWKLLGLCFLQYLPAGFCLAWAYEGSGSIFSPVLIHTTVNAIGIFAMR